MAALAAAREARPGAHVVACSEHAHSSVEKACGSSALEARATPVDEAFRLRPDELDLTGVCCRRHDRHDLDELDRSGRCDRGRVRARRGLAPHVDAYAGSAAVYPELREAFAGWERADSVVVNPHKWLLVPMGCSALWTRRPDDLRAAFSLVPEYLRVTEEVASLSKYSPVLGRQFRALKLWTVLRCYGRQGSRSGFAERSRSRSSSKAGSRTSRVGR